MAVDTETPEPTEPPSFEELPEWFQEEIEERRARVAVAEDAYYCKRHRRRVFVCIVGGLGVLLFAAALRPQDGIGVLFLLAAGIFGALWIEHKEASIPGGVFYYGTPLVVISTIGHSLGSFQLTSASAFGNLFVFVWLVWAIIGAVIAFVLESKT